MGGLIFCVLRKTIEFHSSLLACEIQRNPVQNLTMRNHPVINLLESALSMPTTEMPSQTPISISNRTLGVKLITLEKLVWGCILLVAELAIIFLRAKSITEPIQFLIQEFNLNARSRFWNYLIGLIPSVDLKQLTQLSFFVMAYAVVTLVEAWGIWNQKLWVEIFLLLETAAFLPLEIFELTKKFSATKFGLLIINALIVYYLGKRFFDKLREEKAAKL
jgi:uncharacterized membrane protein (DUF2068 family)